MQMTKTNKGVTLTHQDSVFKLFITKGFAATLATCCSFFAFTID